MHFTLLRENIGFKTAKPMGGVVEGDVELQSIKIYAPESEGERVINVIGNANITRDVKHITP